MVEDADALRLIELTRGIQGEFPRFRIIHKRDSLLSRLIDVCLRVVTLGAQHEYMTRYHTVIGPTLYVPERWDAETALERMIVLRHERIHLRQRRRYGDLLMTFLYLVPFFPLGLAYGRARIEWEAYEETLRATSELKGLDAAHSPELRQHILRQFSSGSYGWMWPFRKSVERWYNTALERIQRDLGGQKQPQRSEWVQ